MSSYLPAFLRPAPPVRPSTSDHHDTEEEEADDTPPSFPLPNSIQRASQPSKPTPKSPLALPPPTFSVSAPEDDGDSPSSSRTASPTLGERFGDLPPPTVTKAVPKKPRKKVALEPGFSQLDWAKLKGSGSNLKETAFKGFGV